MGRVQAPLLVKLYFDGMESVLKILMGAPKIFLIRGPQVDKGHDGRSISQNFQAFAHEFFTGFYGRKWTFFALEGH